jgi:hypothetical protein
MDEMVVKILVELISMLALVTEELKQGRSGGCVLADDFSLLSVTQSNLKRTFSKRRTSRQC